MELINKQEVFELITRTCKGKENLYLAGTLIGGLMNIPAVDAVPRSSIQRAIDNITQMILETKNVYLIKICNACLIELDKALKDVCWAVMDGKKVSE